MKRTQTVVIEVTRTNFKPKLSKNGLKKFFTEKASSFHS